MRADSLGFMACLYFSIQIHELGMANLNGSYNHHGNRSLCISVRGYLDYIHCGEKINPKGRGYHPMGLVLYCLKRRKEAKHKHFLNPPPD